ncbi:MAG: hypothetical protein Q8O60_01140 [Deltaproteobacteria bacterium]|nr:hypothetical protein [Deltaproteobacteria bacterium]
MNRIPETEYRRRETEASVEELLKEKQGLCLKLKENMQAFKEAFQSGDAGLLATITGQRDRFMKAIDALDHRLSLAGFRPAPSQSEKRDTPVQGWIDKLKLTLKEIFVIHEECLAYAEARSQALQRQILCLQRDTRAISGYAPRKNFSPRFIDTAK